MRFPSSQGPSGLNYFAIGGATYLLPYFIAGIAVTRYDLLNPIGASDFFWKVILLLGGYYALVSVMGGVPDIPRVSVLALMLGMAACATAIQIDWSNKPLAYIGRHSYAIFLFHVFFTAGVRIGGHQLGVYNVNLLVLLTAGAGVVGPIAVEHYIQRWPVADALFLGARWRPLTSAPLDLHMAEPSPETEKQLLSDH